MGFRFQKRIKLFPGVRINLSKSGVSASIGAPGAQLNIGGKKTISTAGLPGTGLSYRQQQSGAPNTGGRIFAIIILLALLLAATWPAFADIETDKNAGICWASLTLRKNPGASVALRMADNQKRAAQFGETWYRELKRQVDAGRGVDGLAFEASGACRKVGVRPADYK